MRSQIIVYPLMATLLLPSHPICIRKCEGKKGLLCIHTSQQQKTAKLALFKYKQKYNIELGPANSSTNYYSISNKSKTIMYHKLFTLELDFPLLGQWDQNLYCIELMFLLAYILS